MNLPRALRIQPGESIAFTGAGGKTTALISLARQLDAPVVGTTTTHFSREQLHFADQVIHETKLINTSDFSQLSRPGLTLLVGNRGEDQRVSGISDNLLINILQFTREQGINLLIEADGSREHPLKAPASHEPVIPPFVDQVVVVVGLSGLGKPLNSQYVHRVDRYSELSGLNQGDEITIEAIRRVLTSELGGLKGIPDHARRVCLVNQADNEQLEGYGHRLARYLLSSYHSVIIACLIGGMEYPADQHYNDASGAEKCAAAVHEPVVGIILAAGGSQRLGQPKQLLTWKGKTLINHVARAAIRADLSEVLVVLGAYREAVKAELNDLPVTIIQNSDWEAGQSTSIQVALEAVPEHTGAAVFLLADQPKVSISVIRALVEKHAATLAPIIVPMVDGKRGNPVLFDRSTFRDFDSVKGDVGGRQLFSKYPITWLDWYDPSILMDVDTDDDYQQLISNSNENTI